MDPAAIGWLSIGLLLFLLVLGIPFAFVMGFVGVAMFAMATGLGPALNLSGLVLWLQWNSFEFSVIPLFILMGGFVYHSGLGADIFRVARAWIGHSPGGLATATVVGCGMFGAISGSTIACTATMGKICVPEMIKCGYDRRLTAGVVAASGTLAAMIPPSVLMVIYGIITEQSIGRLLIAGIFPGCLEMGLYIILIFGWVRTNPKIAPHALAVPWKEKLDSLKYSWSIIVLATVIIGGIYTGFFTPTEAGGIGAFVTLLLTLVYRRLKWGGIKESFFDAAKTTGMIFAITGACFIFMSLFAITQIPQQISSFLVGLEINRYVILSGIYLMYYFLGSLISPIPMMFLTLPFIYPSILALGFDPIWFGVMVVVLSEIGNITPPFALTIFTLAGVAPELDVKTIIQGLWRFLVANTVEVIILTIFPQIATFLPSLMGK